MHSDERPYMCDFCEYSCKRQDKLRLHTHRMHYKHHQFPFEKPSFKPRRRSNPPPTMVVGQSAVPKDLSLDTTF